MMRKYRSIPLSLLSLLLLTGCWGKYELTQWGFVQAVAIDQSADQHIQLTTLFYKPSSGGGNGGGNGGSEKAPSAVVIKTEGKTVFDAVRDIPLHLGRKAHWGHMRVIIISEKVAKTKNLGKILDLFVRDYEPWGNTTVTVAAGSAADYLSVKPLIEGTISQQIRQSDKAATRFSSKTTELSLLELMVQMKSAAGVATVPYLYLSDNKPKTIPVAGSVFLKDAKMVNGIARPDKIQSLLMLTDNYYGGIVTFPCVGSSGESPAMESFEVGDVKTKIAPKVKGDSLSVHVVTKLEGGVGEFSCSVTESKGQEDAVAKAIEQTVERNLQSTVQYLQKRKIDAIGIGNLIYRKDPTLWEEWKKDWDDRFAAAAFEIEVDVHIRSTGMKAGKPFTKE